MLTIFFLLLPALAYGNFTIDIDLRTTEPLIDVRGKSIKVVDEADRAAFDIGDVALKKAIATLTKDPPPTDVYVKETGQPFDLHKKYLWDEVKKTVKPVVDIKNTYSCDTDTISINQATITIIGNWVQGNLSDEFDYDVYILPDLSSKLTFKSNGTVSDSEDYNFKGTVNAVKCIIKIEISYEARVDGDVAANYPATRRNSYFWAYDVARVQLAANLTTSVFYKQTIDVSYYREKI